MNAVIIAWVLVVAPGFNSSYAVAGIATEQACKELGKKTATFLQSYRCYSYEAVR